MRAGQDVAAGFAELPVFFHEGQLTHEPRFEWQEGQRILHPESSTRAEGILQAISSCSGVFKVLEPRQLDLSCLNTIHSADLLTVYQTVAALPAGTAIYPSVFPVDHDHRSVNPCNLNHSGAFCLDAGTPLYASTWDAALWSAAAAWDAADYLLRAAGNSALVPLAYALCRPPGHHATRDHFGGYCYLNNAALAARRLEALGRVAIVDIDFHHGNGTQSIFYGSDNVLFASIHGDPETCYPYFWGYSAETGTGKGQGFNLNVPLSVRVGSSGYLEAFKTRILAAVRAFEAHTLVVSAGFDTARGDPLGDFGLTPEDFAEMGRLIGSLRTPAVVVQEGGYDTAELGTNVVSFLRGFLSGLRG